MYLQLIVNGLLGPIGPHAPKHVMLEIKHEQELKVKRNYMVENVQDQEVIRKFVR